MVNQEDLEAAEILAGMRSNLNISVLTERFMAFRDNEEQFDENLELGLLNSFEDIEDTIGKKTVTSNEFASIPRYVTYERVLVNDICFCLKPFIKNNVHICLEHCSHRFHIDCIYKWLTRGSRSCPICRRDAITGIEKI